MPAVRNSPNEAGGAEAPNRRKQWKADPGSPIVGAGRYRADGNERAAEAMVSGQLPLPGGPLSHRDGLSELTTCDCSICRRKNALMVKVHESAFELLAGEGALSEYQFHTHIARHFFCRTCGIYPFHRKRVTPDHLGVNVFCLEDFDPAGIPVRATIAAA